MTQRSPIQNQFIMAAQDITPEVIKPEANAEMHLTQDA